MRLSVLRHVKATGLVCANKMEETLRGLLMRTPSLIPKCSILPAGTTNGELAVMQSIYKQGVFGKPSLSRIAGKRFIYSTVMMVYA